jgi:glycosyltransferase involved in cell wall biosynthesis
MKILMIAYTFPPLLFPATMCYVKLAKGLQEQGHQVAVLAVDPETFQFPGGWKKDDTLCELIPQGVAVHFVKSWENNPFIRLAKRFRLSREIFLPILEPKKIEWTYAARSSVLKHIQADDIDVILSCSQPHCNHLLGRHLKHKMGKPWIAYFSDPWTDNVYTPYSSRRVFRRHLALEKAVVAEADAVYFTSPETEHLVMGKYSRRLRQKAGVLPHSFVPHWYEGGSGGRGPRAGGRIRFVQTGHFYGPRTPLPLLEALALLGKDLVLADCFEFVFYGGMQEEHRRYIEAHGLAEIVNLQGTVPYLESLWAMKDADYLLLIDAPLSSPGESVFLPSKLIDYLGNHKPVVGITPLQGASARVLRETGNIVCDISDIHALADTLAGIVKGTVQVRPDARMIDAYDYRAVTKGLSDSMRHMSASSGK